MWINGIYYFNRAYFVYPSPYLTVTYNNLDVTDLDYDKRSTGVLLTVRSSSNWYVDSKPTWVTITPNTGGAWESRVEFKVDENNNGDYREGIIRLKNSENSVVSISVYQDYLEYEYGGNGGLVIYYLSGTSQYTFENPDIRIYSTS